MARWDEIFSLPVQNPPTLEFSSADLVWSKIEGYRDNIDRLALIPFVRVDDFLRGESNKKECPTRFHVEARRRRTSKTPFKPKVDGILEYILYWCSFGPDDHRKGGVVRPSRNTYVAKNKSAGRPNTKRGCTCHFIVKRLNAEPSVALVIYNQDKHVDKKGSPCHGPQDTKAAGTRAMFAPYISEELRLRVSSLLHVGVSVETIMQRHNEFVEKQGGPCNRDDLLTHRFVRRQERSIRRSTYELDEDDAVSISLLAKNQQSNVFFYENFSDSDPFVLGIQSEWQLQQMIRFGNCRILASNSNFGSNRLKYPVHSLVVFNSNNKAIPVAWIITSRCPSKNTHRWMRALYERVCAKDPSWKLAGFVVDDPLTDISAIREVFQCSVLICFWSVRHAWHKSLIKRCSKIETSAVVSKSLSEAVNKICKESTTAYEFDDLMESFRDAVEFADYFKAVWYPMLGSWTCALKTFPLASQETCAAMEFYHNQMKVRLLNERDQNVYQRADWLVDKLCTKVHSYFWLDEYSGKEDFARYRKEEWMSGPTAWRKSFEIPDSRVVVEGKLVKVFDNQDIAYIVQNPGSEYATCSCSWSKMGNLCEHAIKIIRYFRSKGSVPPSMSMLHYSRSLISMLNCPPFDSLVRDHASSLAVWVQVQLNTQICPENGHTTEPERDVQSKDNCPSDSVSSKIENWASRKRKHTDNEEGGFRDNLVHVRTPETIDNNELQFERSCAVMEVDLTSQLVIAEENNFANDETLNFNELENAGKNGSADVVEVDSASVCEYPSTDISLGLDPSDDVLLSTCVSKTNAMQTSCAAVLKESSNLKVDEVAGTENDGEDWTSVEEPKVDGASPAPKFCCVKTSQTPQVLDLG